jgi:hypothetical protein
MWFTVSLLLKCVRAGEPAQELLWEEKIFLVRAKTEAEAVSVGNQLGKAEEHEYVAADGQPVRWVFQQVERAAPIEADSLGHQTELFSRFLRPSEAKSLLTPFEESA